eukprot:COSAG04_NODE_11665_length_695_cov_1.181208_1_plen_24_part_10
MSEIAHRVGICCLGRTEMNLGVSD